MLSSSLGYALVHSTSVGIEYGAGIGASVRAGGVEAHLEPVVVRNTARISTQGIAHGEWALYSAAGVGSQTLGVGASAGTRLPANPNNRELFGALDGPMGSSLVGGTRRKTDFEISFGASAYFGFGAGVDVTMSLNEFARGFVRRIGRGW